MILKFFYYKTVIPSLLLIIISIMLLKNTKTVRKNLTLQFPKNNFCCLTLLRVTKQSSFATTKVLCPQVFTVVLMSRLFLATLVILSLFSLIKIHSVILFYLKFFTKPVAGTVMNFTLGKPSTGYTI